jgi:pimeloyl-ACP methyl ester carboxylesterase
MPERLQSDGVAVNVGDVVVISPGLTGVVEVHRPGAPGMRAAEQTSPALLDALRNTGVREQLTVEIREPQEVVAAGAGGTTRSTDRGEPAITVEVPGPGTGLGQVLLYTAEDGAVSWHFPDDVPADPDAVATRGGDRRTYTVPRRVGRAEGGATEQRGLIGAVGKKLLKVLIFRLADPVLGKVGDYFAGRWEEAHRRHLLRDFAPDSFTARDAVALEAADWQRLAQGPSLLFVHGTFSECHTGFNRIPRDLMTELHTRYGGRVFAFDHFTVSESPTDNAKWLAKTVPPGAGIEVDIVAQSRGGLVSRVISERGPEIGLTPETLRVRNVVMIATPNAGTVLADAKHLKDLLDRVTNILEFVPDNPVTDTLDIALTVLKQLAVGTVLGMDGLMSMSPTGDYLTKFLNQSATVTATYRAVAANYEPPGGSALLRFARDEATDRIFGNADNDLIVPTQGAYTAKGASAFPIADPLIFDASTGVDHSSYCDRPEFVEALRNWLPG